MRKVESGDLTPRFIAFLRAINVGGRTVRMDHLRRLFESLGYSNVETFIASGNVIFESPARSAESLERKIESRLRKSLGYEVTTFIRSESELREIARYQPFSASELERKSSLFVAFLRTPLDRRARESILRFRSETDDFHLHGRELYWLCRTSFRDSAFSGALLEKAAGMPATIRNVTTVRKLAAKYPGIE